MKRGRIFHWVLLVLFGVVVLVSFQHALSQQSAEELYQAAVFKKESEGDLNGAIQILLRITKEFPADKKIAGKAQLQIGMCYEKLGKEQAIKAYELVLKNFADQPELVAAAQGRMAALQMAKPQGLTVLKIPKAPEQPHFSRDGTKAVGNIWSIPGQNIGVYDYTKEKMTSITQYGSISYGDGITYYAIFSPDAKEVAYWFWPSGKPEERELRIATLDGKSRTIYKIRNGTVRPCDWLPDGSAVLAIVQDENKTWKLGLIPAEGGDFKELRSGNFSGASVSPDGRFVVYAIGPQENNDIEIITVEGKLVGTLTAHPADDESPVWSPDGRYIVFKSNRQGGMGLWGVAVKDGKPESQPVLIKTGMENTDLFNWTSQGLACQTTVIGRDVFVMPINPETSEPTAEARMIDYTPTGDNMHPVWSPDGKYLAFLSVRDKAYIVIMPSSGGRAKEYLVPFENFWGIAKWWLMHLSWLPDSSGVGFKTMWPLPGEDEPTLICLNLESGDWKTWHVPVSWNGAWGLDGKSYIYEKKVEKDEKGLVIRDLDTGTERYIHHKPDGAKGIFRALKSSLDKKKLIFLRSDIGFMALNVESGEARVIITAKTELPEGEDVRHPTWSPDGSKIMWISSQDDDPSRLLIISENGGTPQYLDLGNNLPKDCGLHRPDWSPDGKKIAFHAQTWFIERFFLQNIIPEK